MLRDVFVAVKTEATFMNCLPLLNLFICVFFGKKEVTGPRQLKAH